MSTTPSRAFPFIETLLPFLISVGLLSAGTYYLGGEAMQGFNQIALLAGAVTAIGIGYRRGISWHSMQTKIKHNMQPVGPILVFLLLIGAIATSWILGGIIPSAIFYGIKYLPPAVFLPATFVLTSAMALASGSSWLTVSTIGIALLTIGNAIGLPSPLVAGAILSGAYFGDQLSPLSESTVLASSMSQTPIFKHIRYMLWSAVPTFALALLLFTIFGWYYLPETTQHEGTKEILQVLHKNFPINAWRLVVPLLVTCTTMAGLPSLQVLLAGAVAGAVLAFCTPPPVVLQSAVQGSAWSNWETIQFIAVNTFQGLQIQDANPLMAKLLSTTGIWGMWSIITIILASVLLSSAMEGAGLLQAITAKFTQINATNKLIVTTTATAILFNLTLADQSLAIILTSKIFAPFFKQQGLASENLSRSVEHAATVTSPLIPWNTCGATQAKVLGMSTLAYAPYCFYNLLSPVVCVLCHVLQFHIAPATPTPDKQKEAPPAT